jgi:hypothetical protein
MNAIYAAWGSGLGMTVGGTCQGYTPGSYITCDASGNVVSIELCGSTCSNYGAPSLGTIPTQIGGLTALTQLSFIQGGLTGTIPTQIGLLTNIVWLRIAGNSGITGTIPSEIGGCTALTGIQLSAAYGTTPITGTIPSQLGSLTNLQMFDLRSQSGLTGTIPASMCNNPFGTYTGGYCDKGLCVGGTSISCVPSCLQNWNSNTGKDKCA